MTSQLHDFNPGIGSNGTFWLVEVPDDAIKITGDTLTISLKDVPLVDQFSFPNGAGNNLGIAGVPAKLSFDITYTKQGSPRHIHPTSSDPLSPFNWAGKMWMATNSGTFSLSYDDNTFSAQGSFDSAGNFGEMGSERNGSYLREDDEEADNDNGSDKPQAALPLIDSQNAAVTKTSGAALLATNTPKWKGRVPVSALVHKR